MVPGQWIPGHGERTPGSTPFTCSATKGSTTGAVKLTSLKAGRASTCARTVNGDTQCWGKNDRSQATVPDIVRVGNIDRPLGKISAISMGNTHTCAIRKEDKRVLCWGNNDFGQCSYPMVGINVPFDVMAMKAVVGANHIRAQSGAIARGT